MNFETKDAQKQYIVRPFKKDDGQAIAKVHTEIFPEYFLTHFGIKILALFYQEFVDNPNAFGFVAVRDTHIVGIVAGLMDSASFYRAFYRKNFANLVITAVKCSFRDRSFIREIGKRSQHLFFALGSRFGNRKEVIKFSSPSSTSARLLSIGVLPEARGLGIADALTDRLGQEFSSLGVEKMGLSVFASNDRAIRFYEKNGWECELNNGTSLYFIKSTVPSLKSKQKSQTG